MELIDKEKVIEKINSVLDSYDPNEITSGRYALVKLREFLDTLEVKEVDLEKAIDRWICDAAITYEDCSIDDVIRTAKHFFELGLKAKEGKEL